MNYDYTGEKFIDRIFKDIFLSNEVKHTKKKSDNREEAIRRYLERLERIHQKATKNDRLSLLKSLYFDKYVIKKDNIPYRYSEEDKQTIINNQKKRLEGWIDYLSDENAMYPMWAKYWAFQGMLKLGAEDPAKGYQKRTNKTLAPFIEANPAIIANCIQSMMEYEESKRTNNEEISVSLKSGSFKKLYEYFEKKYKESMVQAPNKSEGVWVKYNQGNMDEAHKLYESLQHKSVPWCTANETTAKTQIDGGDFYVYYTIDEEGNYTIPRIAIRMSGKNNIGEIRGILQGQCLESEMIDVLEAKLKTMDFVSESDINIYIEKVQGQKELTNIYNKTVNKIELTKEEIYNIYTKRYGFGWEQDPMVKKTTNLRNIKEDINKLDKERKIKIITNCAGYLPEDFVIDDPGILVRVTIENATLFQYASYELRSNREIAKLLVAGSPKIFALLNEDLKDDKEIALLAVSANGNMYDIVSERLKMDRDIVLNAVSRNGFVLCTVPDNFKNDKEIVLKAVNNYSSAIGDASEELRNDKDVVEAALSKTMGAFIFVGDTIKDNKEIALKAVEYSPTLLEYVSDRLKNDKDIVEIALSKSMGVFSLTGETIRDNKEIALKAIEYNPMLLENVSERLRNDEEVVMSAISKNMVTLIYIGEKLKTNKEFISKAINLNEQVFKKIVPILDDKKFIMTIVSINGSLLSHASDEFKNDYDVVSCAIKNNHYAIYYASEKFKSDKHAIERLLNDNIYFDLSSISPSFMDDKDIVKLLIEKKYHVGEYLGNNLKGDKEIILSIISDGIEFHNYSYAEQFKYASDELKNDKSFVKEAIKINPYIFGYISDNLKSDRDFIIELLNTCDSEKKGAVLDILAGELPKELKDDEKLNSIYTETLLNLISTENIAKDMSIEEIYHAIDDIENMCKDLILSDKYKNDPNVIKYVSTRVLESFKTVLPEVSDYINQRQSMLK